MYKAIAGVQAAKVPHQRSGMPLRKSSTPTKPAGARTHSQPANYMVAAPLCSVAPSSALSNLRHVAPPANEPLLPFQAIASPLPSEPACGRLRACAAATCTKNLRNRLHICMVFHGQPNKPSSHPLDTHRPLSKKLLHRRRSVTQVWDLKMWELKMWKLNM